MSQGIDTPNAISSITAKNLASYGISFICGYLSPEGSWKRLTKESAMNISNAGIKIISLYESTANRMQGGSTNGIQDAKLAKIQIDYLNQPKNTAIYFACDFDAQKADYDAIDAYLRAVKTVLKDYYIGLYAGYFVIEEMAKRKACDRFFQTYAWSRGNKSKFANLYQYKNGQTLCGLSVDLDEGYDDKGGWNYSMDLTWKDILTKYTNNPDAWEKGITTAINAAKANGNLGDIEIFKYLPDLLEKVYKAGIVD